MIYLVLAIKLSDVPCFHSADLCTPLRLCGYCFLLQTYRSVAEERRDPPRRFSKVAYALISLISFTSFCMLKCKKQNSWIRNFYHN